MKWLRKQDKGPAVTSVGERAEAAGAADDIRRTLAGRSAEVDALALFAQQRLAQNHLADSIRLTIESATAPRRTA